MKVSGSNDNADLSSQATTDESGRFEFAGLAKGRLELLIYGDGELLARFVPQLTPTEPAQTIEITLPQRGALVRLHGSLRRADGTPAADTTMFVELSTPCATGDLQPLASGAIVRTDHEGRFSTTVPPAERVRIGAWLDGGARVEPLTSFERGGRAEVLLELALP